jgi:hypothetical protein
MNFVFILFEMYLLSKLCEMKIWPLGPTFDINLYFELSWYVGPINENSMTSGDHLTSGTIWQEGPALK